jgi:hypothetical protein
MVPSLGTADATLALSTMDEGPRCRSRHDPRSTAPSTGTKRTPPSMVPNHAEQVR